MLKATKSQIFLFCWFIIQLLQAGFTELFNDEAYYWIYSENLAWGYFDHPPLTAILIYLGNLISHSEAGVRLFFVIANTLAVYVLEKIINPSNIFFFYLSLAGIISVQLLGFMATPDSPLFLLMAIYFYLISRLVEKDDLKNYLFLGVILGLMGLTKYYAALTVVFSFVLLPKVFFNKKIIVSFLLAFAIISPHLYWQYEHDWISFQYHLFDRSGKPFNLINIPDYLLGILLITGPVSGLSLLTFALKNKNRAPHIKHARWQIILHITFFFLMSFKGKTEGNWLLPLIVPMYIAGYLRVEEYCASGKIFKNAILFSLVLIVGFRLFLVYNFLPFINSKMEFHNVRESVLELKSYAGNRPVIFMNSYSKAAKYSFYTGEKSLSLNNIMGRRNQYNLLTLENDFKNKNVLLFCNYEEEGSTKYERLSFSGYIKEIPNFNSYQTIRIKPIDKNVSVRPDELLMIDYDILPPFNSKQEISIDDASVISYQFLDRENNFICGEETQLRLRDGYMKRNSIEVKFPKQAGKYDLYISISTPPVKPAQYVCNIIKVEIGE